MVFIDLLIGNNRAARKVDILIWPWSALVKVAAYWSSEQLEQQHFPDKDTN